MSVNRHHGPERFSLTLSHHRVKVFEAVATTIYGAGVIEYTVTVIARGHRGEYL